MNYRETPPAPKPGDLVVRGMIGYHDSKLAQRLEARMDRAETERALEPQKRRLAEIERVARLFRFVDVRWIAAHLEPWDEAEFKTRVIEAQQRYLLERTQ